MNLQPHATAALVLALVLGALILAGGMALPASATDENGSDSLFLPVLVRSGTGGTPRPTTPPTAIAPTPTNTPDPTDMPTPNATPRTYTIAGYVQKGPFVQGTEIDVRELDDALNPTGRIFTGRIEDNTGRFSVGGTLAYPFVELAANGFYFNEITGSLSAAPITLLALVDLREGTDVNVNLLTHLEHARVFDLVDGWLSFSAAKAQAQQEVLAIFNLAGSAIGRSETLNIAKEGTGNAILLAASLILQSERNEAQLTELLSIVSSDLRYDGVLGSSAARQALLDGMEYVKPRRATIRDNMIARYAELEVFAVVPPFEAYSFALDTLPPAVVSTDPAEGDTLNGHFVIVTFNDFLAHATITSTSIRLLDAGDSPIAGAREITDSTMGTVIRFTPTSALTLGAYRLAVTTAVQDIAGNAFPQEFILTFYDSISAEIPIPPGEFQMGCERTNDTYFCSYSDELPLHTVILRGYYIDKYEVANARYRACVDAGACTPPPYSGSAQRESYYDNSAYANYPVITVNWHQAQAFCAWDGRRLPTEAEWEKAARGPTEPGELPRVYPWGDFAPTCDEVNGYVNEHRCVGDTSSIGSHPTGASPYGVMDMSGNVAEWVSDWYDDDYYDISPLSNPTGPVTGTDRALRGGSWAFSTPSLRAASRDRFDPDAGFCDFNVIIGFRCARSQ